MGLSELGLATLWCRALWTPLRSLALLWLTVKRGLSIPPIWPALKSSRTRIRLERNTTPLRGTELGLTALRHLPWLPELRLSLWVRLLAELRGRTTLRGSTELGAGGTGLGSAKLGSAARLAELGLLPARLLTELWSAELGLALWSLAELRLALLGSLAKTGWGTTGTGASRRTTGLTGLVAVKVLVAPEIRLGLGVRVLRRWRLGFRHRLHVKRNVV